MCCIKHDYVSDGPAAVPHIIGYCRSKSDASNDLMTIFTYIQSRFPNARAELFTRYDNGNLSYVQYKNDSWYVESITVGFSNDSDLLQKAGVI